MQTSKTQDNDLIKSRLHSLDALRGFDMFWIAGGVALLRLLTKDSTSGFLNALYVQSLHTDWEGFHFYDLIFPLFMFISGVAIPFSILKKLEEGSPKKDLVWKAFKRMVILIILGTIYGGMLRDGFEKPPRIASVLAQIGIGYFFASLIVIYVRSFRNRLFWLGGILAFITIVQLVIPVPGIGAGVLTPEGCMNGYIDRMLLPGRINVFDPEGLLCCVSAISVTLMGTVAGYFLKKQETSEKRKFITLVLIGAGLIIIGAILSPFYPPIKKCWTPTYDMLAGGTSFLLMAIFYQIIDVWGFKKWAFFFTVIGMNSIFIYLFNALVNVRYTSNYLLGWLTKMLSEDGGQMIITLGMIALTWTLLYIMYKRKIFIRV